MEPKAPGAKCDECPLVSEKHVLGRGPDRARVVVVGEAPGRNETNTGIPFTGASGQLLDKVFAYHGIDREEVYVTNACLCRPPGNATPNKEAIRACRPRLVEEIKRHSPEVILTLGNVASQTLLDSRTGITALRAEPDHQALGVKVIPTFHPAAALRNSEHFPSILHDVGKITRVQVDWEYTKYKVPETVPEGLSLLRQQVEYGGTDTLAADIEVDVEDMKRIDPKNPGWLCFAISHRPGASVVYPEHLVKNKQFMGELDKYMEVSPKKWGWQNGKFDIQHLWGSDVTHARVDEDTMLAHYATDERKGTHDLEQLATQILGAPRYKTDARAYLPRKGASFRHIPPDILHEYNASDADITHRLLEPLHKEMAGDGVVDLYRRLLIPGSNALASAEFIGAKVDRDRLGELDEDLSAELADLEEGLSRWVYNPRSPMQVKAALLELGAVVPGTDKDILTELRGRGGEVGEFAGLLLDYRARAKLLSTYVRGLGRSLVRSRVHPTFLLHGTETGRLSCRRPNLQNIPGGSTIRDAFIAGPENVLLSADYSQIEFRLAGILSGDEWLLEQFRAGREFHKEVARRQYGETWTHRQYLRAKAVNFGVLYGRQAGSLAAEWGISFNEAQGLISNFFRNMPKVREYQKGLEKQIRERGYLESYYGRKRRFWLVTRENWHVVQKEGYNFPLQSTASDLNLDSLIRLEPILRGKAAPIITVHDSLMFEVRKQYLQEVIHTVREVMEDTPFKDICPTPVEIKVGQRWGSLELVA